MKKLLSVVTLVFSFSSSNNTYAEVLKDPLMRDENISNTILSAIVNKRPDGMYEYIYDIQSTNKNKGIIRSFSIDLACDIDFGDVVFSEPPDPYFTRNLSVDGKHVPVEAYGVSALTTTSSISVDNLVSWGLYFKPGETGKGIKLISPAPPGLRTYKLAPSMYTDGWDYGSYDEDDPTVPWIDDFRVTGSITAPACALDTPPTDNRFEGTGRETLGINKLLTYTTPDKDPIYVLSDNEEIKFSIFYSVDITKEHFKARLNGKDVTYLFKPVPDTNERVTIKTKWKRLNELHISVPVNKEKISENEYAKLKLNEFHSKDIDIFHIWYIK